MMNSMIMPQFDPLAGSHLLAWPLREQISKSCRLQASIQGRTFPSFSFLLRMMSLLTCFSTITLIQGWSDAGT